MKSIPSLLIVILVAGVVTFPGITAAQSSANLYRNGLKALRAGDNQLAVSRLDKAIQLNPKDHRYYNDRGVAHKRSGDLEAALSDYSKALEIKPDYTNALNNRGVAYLKLGRFDDAIADFTSALKRKGPLEGKVHSNIGIAYAQKGNHQEAIKHFNEAISFDPSNYRPFLLLAESLSQTGSPRKALRMYQLALSLSRDPKVIKRIENLVSRLEESTGPPSQQSARVSTPKETSAKAIPVPTKGSEKDAEVRSSKARTIVRAHPLPQTTDASKKSEEVTDIKNVESLAGLDLYARKSIMKKLSPVSARIYGQGRQFLEKSDTAKALVRFEDTRQLERRKRSYLGVAWSDLEIGRAYSALGEHHKATPYFEESLRLFKRMRAKGEIILAFAELAKNQKATGQNDRARSLYSKAIEAAVSAGCHSLARAVGDASTASSTKPKKRVAKASTDPKPRQLPRVAKRGTRKQETKKETGRKETPPTRFTRPEKLKEGQQKRIRWGNQAKKPGSALVTRDRKESDSRKAKKSRTERQPKRVVFWANGKKPRAKSNVSRKPVASKKSLEKGLIQEDLDLLRKLKRNNEERKMVIVLERLSKRYSKKNKYLKALYCMDAAMGFREQLRFDKDLAEALLLRGSVKEKLGRDAEALEDFTRAANSTVKGSSEKVSLQTRSEKLARRMGLDTSAVLNAYQSLWKARSADDGLAETRALYLLGQIFEKGGRRDQALKYYERTSASMLADKAQLHRKMGDSKQAEKLLHQAIEALRDIDYSRFIELKRKSRVPNTISLH